mmetsp:Transcript_30449/g.60839  ORF Transcript_30449/g.60839 Transcript_30449/m.60839 type:complete len:83 (+) Transcript_30449:985-1233(+)
MTSRSTDTLIPLILPKVIKVTLLDMEKIKPTSILQTALLTLYHVPQSAKSEMHRPVHGIRNMGVVGAISPGWKFVRNHALKK